MPYTCFSRKSLQTSVGLLLNRGRPHPFFALQDTARLFHAVDPPPALSCHLNGLLSQSSRRSPGILFLRNIMPSACGYLSGGAELGARNVDSLNWKRGQALKPLTRADLCYRSKGLDYCRRVSENFRSRESWGSNMIHKCFLSTLAGRSLKFDLFKEPGAKKFRSLRPAPFSAGATPNVSLDGVSREEQLENSVASSEEKLPGHRTLKLLSGSCYMPHPDKEDTGGEDAHFICDDEQVIGVADGVGGWAEHGVDAGQYARELMFHSVSAIQEESKGSIDPARVLEKAYSSTKAEGSSTACIIALTDKGVHAINLGDSGFIIVRDGHTIFRSPVQQHDFNFTYQLENSHRSDRPSSGQVFTVPVEAGDVIIAGTDGLFDNLYTNEVTTVVVHAIRVGLAPQVMAQKVAALARQRAQDKNRQSPFSAAAQDAGFRYYGGKLDDITVVVSYVVTSNGQD